MDDFDEIYTEHASWLKRYVVLRVGSPDADDVIQDIWLEVHRSLASCRRSGIRTWMRTIAARTVYRHHKRRARRQATTLLPSFARERIVEPPPIEQRDALQRSLEQGMTRSTTLDPVEVAGLVWAEGRSVAEVARAMRLSESRIHHLLGRLRASVQRQRSRERLLEQASSRPRTRRHLLVVFAAWRERLGNARLRWAMQLSFSLMVAWMVVLGLPPRWVGATPAATEGALAHERVPYWLDLPHVTSGMAVNPGHLAASARAPSPEPPMVSTPARRAKPGPRRGKPQPPDNFVQPAPTWSPLADRPVIDLLVLVSHAGHDANSPRSSATPESVAAQIERLRKAVELSRACRLELAHRQLRSVDASLRHTHDRAIADYLAALGRCAEAS